MAKSRDAFRTISEVSEVLDTPAHVLRFWESKFKQIKPVKRAGGRRYYRPDDLYLLAGIKHLLHEQGMTIKGAQKLLREQGVKHVIAIGQARDAPEETMVQTPNAAPEPETTVKAVSEIVKADEESQSEMFVTPTADIVELPTAAKDDKPAPKLRIISAKPVPDVPSEDTPPTLIEVTAAEVEAKPDGPSTLSPFTKPKQMLPPNPSPRADIPARCLAAAAHAKSDRVKENATEIAPLLSRLSALRDEMRHPW